MRLISDAVPGLKVWPNFYQTDTKMGSLIALFSQGLSESLVTKLARKSLGVWYPLVDTKHQTGPKQTQQNEYPAGDAARAQQPAPLYWPLQWRSGTAPHSENQTAPLGSPTPAPISAPSAAWQAPEAAGGGGVLQKSKRRSSKSVRPPFNC